jgi:hypothetical protein
VPTWQKVHRTPSDCEKNFMFEKSCARLMSLGNTWRFLNGGGVGFDGAAPVVGPV